MHSSHLVLSINTKNTFHQLLAESVYADTFQHAANTQNRRLKNTDFGAVRYWESNEFLVADRGVDLDTTLFLDKFSKNGKIISNINYKRIFV